MAMDTEQHSKTYNGFIAASKWGSIVVAIIVVFVVYVIT